MKTNLDRIDITNDFMFSHVMRNPQICKEFLAYLLPGHTFSDVQYYSVEDDFSRTPLPPWSETQKTFESFYDKRGVRLDAYLDDGKTIYSIEMQTSWQKGLAERARLYQAHIDVSQLQKGKEFDELRPSYVIFICKYDPFGKGLYRYSFQNICAEKPELKLNDGTFKLFFNTAGRAGTASEELRGLLAYMNSTQTYPIEETKFDLIRKIEEAVRLAKQDDEWRKTFMLYQVRLQEARREGVQQGTKHEKLQTAKKMLHEGLSTDMIMRITGLSLNEIKEVGLGQTKK